MARLVFHNIEDFYNDNPKRRYSAECDYGMRWKNNGDIQFRISYVEDTQEVYAISSGTPHVQRGKGAVILLAVLPPGHKLPEQHIDRQYYESLEDILDGWAYEMDHNQHGVEWVKERLAAYTP
tara:strand:- start:865 stop:1233 length:369 start_codon:yes stop_codon:yes gene_type:complete